MEVAQKLKKYGEQYCRNAALADVRIGLGYTYVELEDGRAGIAWTPGREAAASCTHLAKAGTLQQCTENGALQFLESELPLERAIGVAAFNAINARLKRQVDYSEAIARLTIQPTDHVVMVGHFAPLIARIEKTGCHLDVFDLNRNTPRISDSAACPDCLARCDVAIITATCIINNTVEDQIGYLQRNRAAVLLGPSTPICPEAFEGTRITQLSGSLVSEPMRVQQIVSQGGGTMLMKKHLQFVNIGV